MVSHNLSTYLSLTILTHVLLALAPLVSSDMLWQDCVSGWNYTANSTYQSNLKLLSTTLPKKATTSPSQLFATDTAGAIPDTVYALALCRGDTNASACAACIANAFRDAQQVCAYVMDVTVYYDPCNLRFSNQNFLTSIDNTKQLIMGNGENVTSPAAAFDAAVGACSPHRRRGLCGAEVVGTVRHRSGGLRYQQPQHLCHRAVHAGLVAG